NGCSLRPHSQSASSSWWSRLPSGVSSADQVWSGARRTSNGRKNPTRTRPMKLSFEQGGIRYKHIRDQLTSLNARSPSKFHSSGSTARCRVVTRYETRKSVPQEAPARSDGKFRVPGGLAQ